MLFYRLDLRMHRKIAVIDGEEIAYTGEYEPGRPAVL